MTDPRITEAMRLAGLLATARCRRMAANTRNEGKTGIDRAEALVQTRTAELQTYLESVLCPKSSNESSTATTS